MIHKLESKSVQTLTCKENIHHMCQTFWEWRESDTYTDVLLVCQDDRFTAHSMMLTQLFSCMDLDMAGEEDYCTLLLLDFTREEVLQALQDLYMRGSMDQFCRLLSIDPIRLVKNSSGNEVKGELGTSTSLEDESMWVNENEDQLNSLEEVLASEDLDVDPFPTEPDSDDLPPASEGLQESDEEELKRPKPSVRAVPKLFNCEYCTYSAVSGQKLLLHINCKHLRIKKYSCQHCTYKTNAQKELKVHMRDVHKSQNGDKRVHSCEHCKEFQSTSLRRLDAHIIEQHKNVRKFHCEECNYSTNYISNFKRHRQMHLGIQGAHICPYCPKTFYVEAKLRSHLLVHTDVKKFVCDECGAKFKRKDDLKAHMKIHLPDEVKAIEKAKKLTKVCETCGKKFEKNYKLNRHMAVHVKNGSAATSSSSVPGTIIKSLDETGEEIMAGRWTNEMGDPAAGRTSPKDALPTTTFVPVVAGPDNFGEQKFIMVETTGFIAGAEPKFVCTEQNNRFTESSFSYV